MVDPVVGAWVLEFLLRRRDVGDALAGELLLALPLPSPLPPRLSATLLLRRLAADLSRRSVSPRTLHSLDLLHRILPFPSLAPAFTAVAVECTVAPLRLPPLSSSECDAEFFDAVNRIWNCLVADLERSEAAGLVSCALREARMEMEAAVVDPALRAQLARRETKEAALVAVRVCLEEMEKEMGPTFLEAAADAIVSCDCETHRSLVVLSDKLRAFRSIGLESVERGVEIGHLPSKIDRARSTVEGGEGIKLNDRNIEKDQMRTDQEQGYSVDKNSMSCELQEVSDHKSCDNNYDDVPQSGQMDPVPPDPKDKPSLMDRNATAHTFEWDSIPTHYGKSPNMKKEMDYFSSMNSKSSSSLNETKEYVLRRRKRKWNSLEEETLRKAVARYGAGNWKLIKGCHPEIFERRTEVDLKDKWRNMTRHM
uniref:Uncharacterized protein n=1 Tax=Musa acuminata subsp. malaccensis TaxID=214687 RepID=A0A804IX42_MUSAM|nr:PREDICTED: uncharacterized protein LOC103982540 isoform X2 [Musa acuminata subsp. malaccensis]